MLKFVIKSAYLCSIGDSYGVRQIGCADFFDFFSIHEGGRGFFHGEIYDRYQIIHMGWQRQRRVHQCVMHMDIRDDSQMRGFAKNHAFARSIVNPIEANLRYSCTRLLSFPITMSKFPHDEFAKNYLTELLNTIGKANPNELINSERREGDVWFERDPSVSIVEQRKRLGLLGQLLTHDSLIEVFRNATTEFEVRSCKAKLAGIEAKIVREAERRDEKVVIETLPHVWLITPTASEEIQRGFGFRKTRVPGVYRLPKLDRTGVIVVHQLKVTDETLWIRMLGKKGNQNRAIQEFLGQSTSSVLYDSIGEILANYRSNLEASRPLESEEEELIMNLSAAYLKKREEWKEEGRDEVIIKFLRKGMSSRDIAETIGLPIETIESLRDRV